MDQQTISTILCTHWQNFFPKETFFPKDTRIDIVTMFFNFFQNTGAEFISDYDFFRVKEVTIDAKRFVRIFGRNDLLDALITRPQEMLGCLGLSLTLIKKLKSPFSPDTPIVPCITNLGVETHFHELKSSKVGQLVCLEGFVIRVSACCPLVEKAIYTCSKCGINQWVIFEDGVFNPPSKCPRKGCYNKILELQRNSAATSSFQRIKIQEAEILATQTTNDHDENDGQGGVEDEDEDEEEDDRGGGGGGGRGGLILHHDDADHDLHYDSSKQHKKNNNKSRKSTTTPLPPPHQNNNNNNRTRSTNSTSSSFIPRTFEIEVRGGFVHRCVSGDRVKVVGVLSTVQVEVSKGAKFRNQESGIHQLFLLANSLEVVRENSSSSSSPSSTSSFLSLSHQWEDLFVHPVVRGYSPSPLYSLRHHCSSLSPLSPIQLPPSHQHLSHLLPSFSSSSSSSFSSSRSSSLLSPYSPSQEENSSYSHLKSNKPNPRSPPPPLTPPSINHSSSSSSLSSSSSFSTFSSSPLSLYLSIALSPNPCALLVQSLCPGIWGHELVKLGLLLGLFGGTSIPLSSSSSSSDSSTSSFKGNNKRKEEKDKKNDDEYHAKEENDNDDEEDEEDEENFDTENHSPPPSSSHSHPHPHSHPLLSTRSDIHVLLVGDPGLGKSQLLRAASALSSRSVMVSGSACTAAGLTATVSRDSGGRGSGGRGSSGGGIGGGGGGGGDVSVEAGALVLADGGLCCIDELDKISCDYHVLLESMEQQSVSLAKGGMITTLLSRCSVFAAANPVHGHYLTRKSVHENLKMPSSLLSRFDLVFILLDSPDEERDQKIGEHILGQGERDREGNKRARAAGGRRQGEERETPKERWKRQQAERFAMRNEQQQQEEEEEEEEGGGDEEYKEEEYGGDDEEYAFPSVPLHPLNIPFPLPSEVDWPSLSLSQRLKIQCSFFISRELPLSLFKSYITYCRTHIHPSLSPEAAKIIQFFYLTMRSHSLLGESLSVTTRHLESLIRLCQARARLEMREIVNQQDAEEIVMLIQESLIESFTLESGEIDYFGRGKRKGNGKGKGEGRGGGGGGGGGMGSGSGMGGGGGAAMGPPPVGKSLTKQIRFLVQVLHREAQIRGESVFTRQEIAQVVSQLKFERDVDTLIETMRTECLLLLKGPKLYQLQSAVT